MERDGERLSMTSPTAPRARSQRGLNILLIGLTVVSLIGLGALGVASFKNLSNLEGSSFTEVPAIPPAQADLTQLSFGVNLVQDQVQRAAEARGLPGDTPVLGSMTPAGGTVTFHPPGGSEIPVELVPWPVVNVFVSAELYGTPKKMTATYAYELSVRTRYGHRIEAHTMVLSSDPPR